MMSPEEQLEKIAKSQRRHDAKRQEWIGLFWLFATLRLCVEFRISKAIGVRSPASVGVAASALDPPSPRSR